MQINLKAKRFCIFGLPGTGKSVLARYILDQAPSSFVYDPQDEHDGYSRYVPRFIDYGPEALEELDTVVELFIIPEARRPALFLVDEAASYAPGGGRPMAEGLNHLRRFSRHLDLSLGFVAHRLVDLAPNLVNLCDYLFLFRLTGRNDRNALEDTVAGLSEVVSTLPPYHFVVVDPHRHIQVHRPVPMEKTGP
ncbi:MAG: ATP-binding protein [Chloroflexi bacterium]|nr:ATP-binding protein [Chloroflexota bacterium]